MGTTEKIKSGPTLANTSLSLVGLIQKQLKVSRVSNRPLFTKLTPCALVCHLVLFSDIPTSYNNKCFIGLPLPGDEHKLLAQCSYFQLVFQFLIQALVFFFFFFLFNASVFSYD